MSEQNRIPQHVAIIMDGNGRWAERRGLARHAGHREGIPVVRMCVEECLRRGIGALGTVLVYLGIAFFLAIAVEPLLQAALQRGVPRWLAIVALALILLLASLVERLGELRLHHGGGDRVHPDRRTEFDGEFYSTPKLEMSPTPPPIPIMFGGLTDIALDRAAHYDGWIGDICSTNEAIDVAGRLHEKRRAAGLPVDDYTVMVALNDAITPDDIARAEAGGVTHIMTQPWWFYDGPDATLDQKIDAMSRYREDFLPG